MTLEKTVTVNAIQINFEDDHGTVKLPEGAELFTDFPNHCRYIEDHELKTKWLLEGSNNDKDWFVIEDKSNVETDLPHDLIVIEQGIKARYAKLTFIELPYNQTACVCGLRVFGKDETGEKPKKVENVVVKRNDQMTMEIEWQSTNPVGFEVLWGIQPDKLYHNFRVFGKN